MRLLCLAEVSPSGGVGCLGECKLFLKVLGRLAGCGGEFDVRHDLFDCFAKQAYFGAGESEDVGEVVSGLAVAAVVLRRQHIAGEFVVDVLESATVGG